MVKKETPLDVDEENALREKYAGMLPDEIEAANSAIRTQKQKSATASGDLAGKLEVFEKQGGHKSAMKAAAKVADMEAAEAQDWVRSFLAYIDALGVNDQMDMVDNLKEQEKNGDSIEAATVAANKSAPQTGAEPAVH